MGNLPWLTFASLLIHIAEEVVTGFPAWATAHFGTTTPGFYALSHVPLVAAAAYVASRASRSDASGGWLAAGIALQAALGANGLFHIGTTLLFHEYSPGLVTGVGLFLPLSVYLLRRASRDSRIGPAQVFMACAVGVIISGLIAASLTLTLDFV